MEHQIIYGNRLIAIANHLLAVGRRLQTEGQCHAAGNVPFNSNPKIDATDLGKLEDCVRTMHEALENFVNPERWVANQNFPPIGPGFGLPQAYPFHRNPQGFFWNPGYALKPNAPYPGGSYSGYVANLVRSVAATRAVSKGLSISSMELRTELNSGVSMALMVRDKDVPQNVYIAQYKFLDEPAGLEQLEMGPVHMSLVLKEQCRSALGMAMGSEINLIDAGTSSCLALPPVASGLNISKVESLVERFLHKVNILSYRTVSSVKGDVIRQLNTMVSSSLQDLQAETEFSDVVFNTFPLTAGNPEAQVGVRVILSHSGTEAASLDATYFYEIRFVTDLARDLNIPSTPLTIGELRAILKKDSPDLFLIDKANFINAAESVGVPVERVNESYVFNYDYFRERFRQLIKVATGHRRTSVPTERDVAEAAPTPQKSRYDVLEEGLKEIFRGMMPVDGTAQYYVGPLIEGNSGYEQIKGARVFLIHTPKPKEGETPNVYFAELLFVFKNAGQSSYPELSLAGAVNFLRNYVYVKDQDNSTSNFYKVDLQGRVGAELVDENFVFNPSMYRYVLNVLCSDDRKVVVPVSSEAFRDKLRWLRAQIQDIVDNDDFLKGPGTYVHAFDRPSLSGKEGGGVLVFFKENDLVQIGRIITFDDGYDEVGNFSAFFATSDEITEYLSQNYSGDGSLKVAVQHSGLAHALIRSMFMEDAFAKHRPMVVNYLHTVKKELAMGFTGESTTERPALND